MITMLAVTALLLTPQPARERWLALKQQEFAVPDGRRAVDLLVEMNPLLASPDPVLRDEIAYEAAERWIVREKRLTPDDLRKVRDLWLGNLQDGIGTRGDDRVFKRSFSALCLSLVAASDLQAPFLEDAEYHRLLDATLAYLGAERDVRGFDAAHGWMHSVAHTADVLKFLGRNAKLNAADAQRILAAIALKLQASDAVFQWGEADRLADALVPIARKQPALVRTWLQPWPDRAKQLWAKGPIVDPQAFAAVQNTKQTLESLYATLQLVLADGTNATPDLPALTADLLKTLGGMR